jgi:hypothetical protein
MPVTQVFTNQLNFVAGYFGRGMLQKVVLPADNSKAFAIAGRCGYLDSNGRWVHGPCPGLKGIPFFVWRGVNNLDTTNDGTDSGDSALRHWISGNARGFITCFAGTGGYEFQTTEFVPSSSPGYNNGDPLTVASDGKLTYLDPQSHTSLYVSSTPAIVGFASPFHQTPENFLTGNVANQANASPVGTNAHGKPVLNFHTWFIPKAA